MDEPGLADARLRADGDDLALADPRELEPLVEAVELRSAPDEPREVLGVSGPDLRASWRSADELRDLDRRVEPLDRARAERPDLDGPLGEPERARRDDDGARVCHLLHARGQVRRLADGRELHVEVVADRAYDDLAGVEPDPDPD